MPRPTRLLALALLAGAIAPASAAADAAPVTEQIIVRHRAGLDAAEREDLRAEAETSLERTMRLPNTEVVAVEEGTRAEALAELRADPDVLWAEPNRVARMTRTTDTNWSYLWALRNDGPNGSYTLDVDIDAQQAWTVTRGAGAVVAVVDTGVQSNHPDLAGRVLQGFDYVDRDTNPADLNGHGTHVAGIVAASLGNGVGVAGIAPAAKILPLRVLDANGDGYFSDIADAFYDAGQAGVQVVNASLGGPGPSSTAITTAIATNPNTLYVIAAGNDAQDNDAVASSPCDAPGANVLCVGATTGTDAMASFSNWGATTVDLFAPGTWIYSTMPGSSYTDMQGTSMATPYVAGTAALVAASTSKRGADIATQIKSTVQPVAGLATKSVTGGRLNAARAVGADVDSPSRVLSVSGSGGVGAATVTVTSPPADLEGVTVYDSAFNALGATTDGSLTVAGVPAGLQSLVVLGHLDNGSTTAAKAVNVLVTAPPTPTPEPTPTPTPTPIAPVTRAPTTPVTILTPTTPSSPVSDVRLVKRGSHTSLVFRVTRTARVTVTLSRLRGGTYRRTASKTVRLTPGMHSLPVTSRLLGMRVPAGRWRVTVGTSTAAASSVTFRKR